MKGGIPVAEKKKTDPSVVVDAEAEVAKYGYELDPNEGLPND